MKAVDKSLKQPNNREELLSESKERLRSLFGAADGEVNFLYDKYEARLNRWLLQDPAEMGYEDIFPDYTRQDFENEFSRFFIIISSEKIKNSKRILYLMQKKEN